MMTARRLFSVIMNGFFTQWLLRTRGGYALLAAGAVAVMAGCFSMGPSEEASGGTGGEIVGTAEYPDSSGAVQKSNGGARLATAALPVIDGNVFVYPRSFIPDTAWVSSGALPRAYTDSLGVFHVKNVPFTDLLVEVNDGRGHGITRPVTVSRDTVYQVGAFVVRPAGSISIQADCQLPGRVRYYVSVRGTRLVARGNQSGVAVTLDDVPGGVAYTVNVRVYEPVVMNFDIPNVVVNPGLPTTLQTFQIR